MTRDERVAQLVKQFLEDFRQKQPQPSVNDVWLSGFNAATLLAVESVMILLLRMHAAGIQTTPKGGNEPDDLTFMSEWAGQFKQMDYQS